MAAGQWSNRILSYAELDPESILANEKNWRIHAKFQQDALTGVLNDIGFVQSVIINKRTSDQWGPNDRGVETLVDGHLRVQLALSKGQKAIPAVFVDLSPEEEAEALATFDPIAGLAVADKEQLDSLLKEVNSGDAAVTAMLAKLAQANGIVGNTEDESRIEDDEAGRLLVKWGTAKGQCWEIPSHKTPGSLHRLVCGDCLNGIAIGNLMDNRMPSLLLTDPPYNVGVFYGSNNDDSLPESEYEAFTRNWFGCWRTISRRQIVTPGCNNMARWLRYFNPYHIAPWIKTNSMTHGKTSRFWCWEPIVFHGEPDEWGWEGILFFGTNWERKRANDVFDYPIGSQKEVGGHPCPKPLGMWSDLIRQFTKVGELVSDGFLGSGTTMVAAEQTGRICYGMEIEPKYIAVALERMSGLGLEPRLIEAPIAVPQGSGAVNW